LPWQKQLAGPRGPTFMQRIILAALTICLVTGAAVAQDGNSTATVTTQQAGGGFTAATVTSAVNIRTAPDSKTSQVIGTLQSGGTVMVRCSYGWCELEDGGYVAQKFLSFDGSSFDVVQPPTGGDSTAGQPSTPLTAAPASDVPAAAVPDFSGTWTVLDAAGQPQRVLKLTQEGAAVTGTLEAPSRTAKITGQIGGTRLDFTYQMLNEKGDTIGTGTGNLDIGEDGKSLNGLLMLNGLVLGNIDAVRQ